MQNMEVETVSKKAEKILKFQISTVHHC